jgi:hypothetical protein
VVSSLRLRVRRAPQLPLLLIQCMRVIVQAHCDPLTFTRIVSPCADIAMGRRSRRARVLASGPTLLAVQSMAASRWPGQPGAGGRRARASAAAAALVVMRAAA